MAIIGVISDTHDNVWNIQKAVRYFNRQKLDVMIHCGDIVAPATVKFFYGIKARKIIFVKGNCDGDIGHIKEFVEKLHGKFSEHGTELRIGEKLIGIYHGDNEEKLEGMINSKRYDYVMHGHTHEKRDEMIGNTRVINPGAHYFHSEGTVAVLDTEKDKLKFKKLR